MMESWIGSKNIQSEIKTEDKIIADIIFDYDKGNDCVWVMTMIGIQETRVPLPHALFVQHYEYIKKVKNGSV